MPSSTPIFIVSLTLASLLATKVEAKKELQFVQAIWRHGDRAPGGLPYPNDKHTEDNWPRGWNQLTNEGMRQLKDLGRFFRERYAGSFVNRTFNVKEVFVQSSDKARAIVSAQSMLNGFFPPAVHEKFDGGLDWHPIPVHSTSVDGEDPLLKPTKFECPEFDRQVEPIREIFSSNLLISPKNKEVFDFLRSNTGYAQIGLEQLKSLAEITKEIEHKMVQPDWTAKRWPEFGNKSTVELIKGWALEERLTRLSTRKLAKLRGGYLLGDWLERALKVQKGKQKKPRKMLLYSSHDGTLQSFLHALELADGVQIPYGGCIILEIYKDSETHQYTTKLLFRDGQKLRPLLISSCGEDCPVDKFFKFLKRNAIFSKRELYKACGRDYCDRDETPSDKKKN